jgi:hypothetical protein
LEESGNLVAGRVQEVKVAPLRSHASAAAMLVLTYTAGASSLAPSTLFCKLFHGNAFWGGWAEVTFFEELVRHMDSPSLPCCYAAAADRNTQAGYVLLQDLRLTHFLPAAGPRTTAQYEQAVDALARLHAHWWEHPRLEQPDFLRPHGGPLRMAQVLPPASIRRHGAWLAGRLPAALSAIGASLTKAQRAFCLRAVAAWPELLATRAAGGRYLTLLHGDFHHDGNLWLPRHPGAGLKIVDWETYKRGVGVYDLAYLLAYRPAVRRRQERALLRRYWRHLTAAGIAYSQKQCLYDYRLALLACLFPLLLWPNAPALHAVLEACARWHCHTLLP